jgi:hypothetical protein
MNKRLYSILYICGLIFLFLSSRPQVSPGYMDADYYYVGGKQLADGVGFKEPIIWNYLDNPAEIMHPSNAYWMPLASILAAAGMYFSGIDGFGAARLGFIVIGALVPVLAAALAYSLSGKTPSGLLAGLLALFSCFYLPYLTTTDTFGLYMLFGGLFVLILGLMDDPQAQPRWIRRTLPIFLGLTTGLMHLARADGFIWLAGGVLGIVLIGRNQRSAEGDRRMTSGYLPVLGAYLIGYLIVMGPWFIRNMAVFGTPLSPGGMRSLWLTNYNELFTYPAGRLSFEVWLRSGLVEIIQARMWALRVNLTSMFVVQGQIFLTPLILAGLWTFRRDTRIKVATLIWLGTFIVMSLAFPYPGARGGFFHSGAALQPIFWAVAPTGLDVFIALGRKWRGWKGGQAQIVFQIGLVVLALFTTLLIYNTRVIGGNFQQPHWNQSASDYIAVEEVLKGNGANEGEAVLVNNPPGYYLVSGRPGVVIPDAGTEVLQEIARKYSVDYLLLEANHPQALDSFYDHPGQRAGFSYLGQIGTAYLYGIDP